MQARHLRVIEALVPILAGAVIMTGEVLHGGASARPLPAALGLGAAATLWARYRAPGWTLLGSGALVLILFHVDHAAAAIAVIAPAVGLYSVGMTRSRPQRMTWGIVAVAAVLGADVLHHGAPTALQTTGHVLLVAIPLLAADAIRTHRSYLTVLTERVALMERTREQDAERRAEQERMRIARELHDVVAHTLTTINIQAAAAAERLEPGDPRRSLERIERASHDAIGELRALLEVLRDRDPAQAPRFPAPGIDDIAELVERDRQAGLDVQLTVSGDRPKRLSEATSLAAYRIVQESLTNARRHAAGAKVRVRLDFAPNHLSIAAHSGPSGPANSNGTTPGVGIAGMRERASAIGGTLHAGLSAEGFTVRAELPCELER